MRPDEVEKYSACYLISSYNMSKHRYERARKDIESIPKGSTYLDVGCGRGETLDLAESHGLIAFGTEIVPTLCDACRGVIRADIKAIPFESFDYVSCYDVLEHLPLEDVGPALDELFRVAGKTLFITTNDNRCHLGDDELHLTRKPRQWWEDEFSKRGYNRIEHCTFATERDWHWRITKHD